MNASGLSSPAAGERAPWGDGPPPLSPGSEARPGYVVVAHLRRGDTLDVYDLWSTERRCRVVGKTLRPDRSPTGAAARRLRAEARLLLGATHPHLVRAYELVPGSPPLLVLETLPGTTLARLIDDRGKLTPGEVAHLGQHLCSAVGYLHRRGVLHLDLKPSNVVAACGVTKLLDLSVARPPGRVPAGVGTLGYMAPEQVRGGEAGPAADVWGICALLYEALSGQQAAAVEDHDDGHAVQRVAPPTALPRRRLPPPLRKAVLAGLTEAPSDRPSVEDIATALARSLG